MIRFSTYGGNCPEDLVDVCPQSPSSVLLFLNGRLYPPRPIMSPVPSLQRNQDPLVAFQAMGAAHTGDWYPLQVGSARRARLIIHWPSLIRGLPDIIQTAPPLAALLWMFKDLFMFRSYFMGTALHRKLLHHALPLYNISSTEDYPPLTAAEDAMLTSWLQSVSNDFHFIKAIKASFLLTVGSVGRNLSSSGLAKYPTHTRMKYSDCSVIDVGHIPVHHPHLPDSVALDRMDEPLFYSEPVNSMLFELLYASRVVPPSVGGSLHSSASADFGVHRFSIPKHNPPLNLMAVNFSRFYPHRARYDATRFRRARPKYNSKYMNSPDVIPFIPAYIEDNYKSLHPACGTLVFKDILFGPGNVWEDVTEWDSCVVVDSDALASHGMLQRKRTSNGVAPRSPTPAERRDTWWNSRLHECLYNVPHTSVSHKFNIVYHRGTVLFTSPWLIPDTDRTTPTGVHCGERRYKLADGVHKFPSHDEYFYTLNFLKYCPSFPGTGIDGLLSWMEGKAKTTLAEFRKLKNIDAPTVRRSRFTEAQDQSIIALYRPGMSEDDKAMLAGACEEHSPRSISQRASQLCKRLIASGIYELSRLPHKNYNSRLAKRIRNEKLKNQWVREETTS